MVYLVEWFIHFMLLLANKIPHLAKHEVSAVQPRRVVVFKPCRSLQGHKKHRSWPEHSSLLPLEAGPLLLNSNELYNVGTQNLNYLSRRLGINYRGNPGRLYSYRRNTCLALSGLTASLTKPSKCLP